MEKVITDERLIGRLADELGWRGKTSEDEFMTAYNAAVAALDLAGVRVIDENDYIDNF